MNYMLTILLEPHLVLNYPSYLAIYPPILLRFNTYYIYGIQTRLVQLSRQDIVISCTVQNTGHVYTECRVLFSLV